ncbi:hypothetical protein Bbelb_275990 [Branchiostoma belcheri]|nr:hypothetical protein Bbelb_275990 [Branchiostoma belcheri]
MCAHVPIVSALRIGITNQAPCKSTPHMSAPFGKTKMGLRRHVRSRNDCQRPSYRHYQSSTMQVYTTYVSALRKDESGPAAPCALTPVSLAPFVPASHASSAESGRRDVPEPLTINGICGSDASRPSVPFAVTSRLFALFVSHIRNEEIDAMHTYFGNKSSAQCRLTSDG